MNLIAGILHNPKFLFLDEPTVGVDVQSKKCHYRFLKVLNQNGTTMYIYSHHLLKPRFLYQYRHSGPSRIYAQGTPSSLIDSTDEARNLEEFLFHYR